MSFRRLIDAGLGALSAWRDLSEAAAAVTAAVPARRAKRFQVHSIAQRVALIAKQMNAGKDDQQIIELARSIVSERCGTPQAPVWCVPVKDKRAETIAVHRWIRTWGMRYVSDPVNVDTYSSARASIRMRAGDCDELISAEGALLGAIGIPVELVVIQELGEADWSHIYGYALFSEAGNLIRFPIDPAQTNEEAGWEVPPDRIAKKRVFPVFR